MNILGKLWGKSILNIVSITLIGASLAFLLYGAYLAGNGSPFTGLLLMLIGGFLVSDRRTIEQKTKTFGVVTIFGVRTKILIYGWVIVGRYIGINYIEVSFERQEKKVPVTGIKPLDNVPMSAIVYFAITPKADRLSEIMDVGGMPDILQQIEALVSPCLMNICSIIEWSELQQNQQTGVNSVPARLKDAIIADMREDCKLLVDLEVLSTQITAPAEFLTAFKIVALNRVTAEGLRVTIEENTRTATAMVASSGGTLTMAEALKMLLEQQKLASDRAQFIDITGSGGSATRTIVDARR